MANDAHDHPPAPTPPPGREPTQLLPQPPPAETLSMPSAASHDSRDERPTIPGAGRAVPCVMPARLGRYEVVEQLAAGGMGVIYLGRDPILRRVVAIKTIRSGALACEEEISRFYIEARAAARLTHRHIVPIHEVGEQDGQPYFAMQFAPGGSLARNLGRFAGDARAAAELVRKVALAVQHAHGHGVLHRDLKPANILLDEEGEPLVTDFGLAKFVGADTLLTHMGQQVGTPAYMAPEQASGCPGRVSERSDVWALGVILFELLTGRRPFSAGSTEELARNILAAAPPAPCALRPNLPPELETIVLQCLEKDPEDRYASAGDLAADLAGWLEGVPPSARRAGWARRSWRRLCRRPHPVAAALLGGLFAAFVIEAYTALAPAAAPPERVREERRQADALLADLRAGRPVLLVGREGRDRAYPWHADDEGYVLLARAGQPLRLDTHTVAQVPLLPDPEAASYRLVASVRKRSDDRLPVGLYAGHATQPSGNGTEHWQWTFTFSARSAFHYVVTLRQEVVVIDGAGRRGSHGLGGVTRELPTSAGALVVASCVTALPLPPLNAAGPLVAATAPLRRQQQRPQPWHTLALEVGPRRIKAWWDGRELGELTPARVASAVATAEALSRPVMKLRHDVLLPPPFAFTGRGAVGLHLLSGSAEYRDVTLTPLPPR